MSSLPTLQDKPGVFQELNNIKSTYNMDDLYKMIKKMVGADCWGIKVNDEIIFNSYNDETKLYKDILMEDLIRSSIYDNPHILLRQLFIRKTPAEITIYMFGSNSWGIIIKYDRINNDNFNVSVVYE